MCSTSEVNGFVDTNGALVGAVENRRLAHHRRFLDQWSTRPVPAASEVQPYLMWGEAGETESDCRSYLTKTRPGRACCRTRCLRRRHEASATEA